MDSSQKFSVVLPAEIQKSESGEWRVYGLASTPKRDLQGEVISLAGIDLDPIKKGKGLFNWDHGTGPENTIGAIDTYKKADDGLYLGGYLFKEHDKAKSIYQIMASLKKSDKGRIGMSVEGIIKKRSGEDGKVISKATITKCALTLNPVNTDTYADLVKSLSAGDVEFDADALDDDGSFDSSDALEKAGEGTRGGKIVGHTRSGKPIYATSGHSMHHDFTPDDHYDAAAMHAHLYHASNDKAAEKRHDKGETEHRRQVPIGHPLSAGLHASGEGRTHFRAHGKDIAEGKHAGNDPGERRQRPRQDHVSARAEIAADKQRSWDAAFGTKKSLGVGAAQATSLPQNISGGDALAHEDLDHKEKKCEKCHQSEALCKCSKEMKKGDATFYKALLCDLMDQLKILYPEAKQTELWEAVKNRLDRKFPSLK